MRIIKFPNIFLKNLLVVALAVILCCGCGPLQNATIINTSSQVASPIFTDPAVKLVELQSQDFTEQLINEALSFEQWLKKAGMQVHMGYWSGSGNRAYLMLLLNSINAQSFTAPVNLAIWDEGVNTSSAFQYPTYITMNQEYWYERVSEVNHILTVNGVSYVDPYTVTLQNANDIWGAYSQRYADMATYFYQQTGNPAKAWCFVQGAYANRVFYTYELPELRILEAAGVVQVYFAKTQYANWQNPSDWLEGTNNAPAPLGFSFKNITSIYDR